MVRQAKSLDTLLAEVNKHAPSRNKASDGGLGDPAHAARVSDHNPNAAGVWRARDFTNDPTDLPGRDLADRLKSKLGKHPAMMSGAYIIFNRKIVSFDRLPEGWRPYGGDNPHEKHVHLSVSTAASGYDSKQAWNLWAGEPLPPTRVTRARDLLLEAIKHSGPMRAAAIRAGLKLLPKR